MYNPNDGANKSVEKIMQELALESNSRVMEREKMVPRVSAEEEALQKEKENSEGLANNLYQPFLQVSLLSRKESKIVHSPIQWNDFHPPRALLFQDCSSNISTDCC